MKAYHIRPLCDGRPFLICLILTSIFLLSGYSVSASTTYYVLDGAQLIPQMPTVDGNIISIDRRDRVRDFTFSSCATNVPFFAGKGGGAKSFAEELAARIGRETNRCVIVGHSLGGLFALEFRHRYPKIQCGIMAFDPSLWWNLDESWTSLDERDLYVAFATKKQQSPLAALGKPCVVNFCKNHSKVSETYPCATHRSIFGAAITNGLVRLTNPN